MADQDLYGRIYMMRGWRGMLKYLLASLAQARGLQGTKRFTNMVVLSMQ